MVDLKMLAAVAAEADREMKRRDVWDREMGRKLRKLFHAVVVGRIMGAHKGAGTPASGTRGRKPGRKVSAAFLRAARRNIKKATAARAAKRRAAMA